jgi:predicted alpha/beta-hydrolase family hydrolase
MSDKANSKAGSGPEMDLVSASAGPGGNHLGTPRMAPRAAALLGHGTATGVEAPDLQAIAAALPEHGVSVALVTQPYRISRTRAGSSEASLDAAWRAVWPIAADVGVRVISAGPSAGSQVACRTAGQLPALPRGFELTEIPPRPTPSAH